jgi:hypothetical protein
MANTLSVIDFVTRESLRVAHETATFLSTIDRSYDDSFSRTGGKQGDALRVRNPNEFVRRKGSRIMDVQDVTETTQSVAVATQDGVDLRFNSAEMSLALDELSKRYIEPAVKTMISGIEADVLAGITKGVANQVGAHGTVPGASGDISAFGNARAKLNQGLAPVSDRSIQLDSVTMASVVNGTKSLFHDGSQVKKAFVEGYFSRSMGFDWYENERILNFQCGSDHTTVALNDASIASGDSTVTMSGSNNGLSVGDVFTVADVKAVHPQTKQALAHDKQFVVTAISGNDVTFDPPWITSGPKQNVDHLPTTLDVVTVLGTASAFYRTALAYTKEFATFVTADLPLMDDAAKCMRRTQDGLTVRVWQASDIRNDEMLLRIDMLYGYKLLRPEWGCRIICN